MPAGQPQQPGMGSAEQGPIIPEIAADRRIPRWALAGVPSQTDLGPAGLAPTIPQITMDRTPSRWGPARFERQPEADQDAPGATWAGTGTDQGPPPSALARLQQQTAWGKETAPVSPRENGDSPQPALPQAEPNSSPSEIVVQKKPSPMVLVRLQPQPAAAPGPTAPPSAQGTQPTPTAALDLDARPINSLNTDTRISQGVRPADIAEARLTQMTKQVTFTALARRHWIDMLYDWEAPGLCHNPLYFEEVNLERYGYRWPCAGVLQPVVSCGQFFATIPALPYKLAAESPCECVYTLGHYRPGSAVPYQVHFPRWRPSAGAAEAGAIVGLIFAIP